MTTTYTGCRGGVPIDLAFGPLYAWYGAAALLPHLWVVLGLPGAEIELRFHPPVPAAARLAA